VANPILGAIQVLLGLDTAAFSEGAKDAETVLGNLERSFKSVAKTVAGGLFAGFSVAGVIKEFKHAVDAADELSKASQKFGVGVESLSALKYAAELADVSFQSLGVGLRKLAQATIDGVTKPTSAAAAAFATLGISMDDLKGKSPEEVLLKVADSFARLQDDATKTKLAVTLFGRAGADLIPFLNQGSAGITKLTAEAQKLGLIVSAETAKAAEEFNDALKKTGMIIPGVANQILKDLTPSMKAYTRAVDDWIDKGGPQKLGKEVSKSVNTTVEEFTLLTTAGTRTGTALKAAWDLGFNFFTGEPHQVVLESAKKLDAAIITLGKTVEEVHFEFGEALEGARNLDVAELAMNKFALAIKDKANPNILLAEEELGRMLKTLKQQVDQQRVASETVTQTAGAQAAAKIVAEILRKETELGAEAVKKFKDEMVPLTAALQGYIDKTQQASAAKGLKESLQLQQATTSAEIEGINKTIAEKEKLIQKRRLEIEVQQGKQSADQLALQNIEAEIAKNASLKERLDAVTNTRMLDLEAEKKAIEGRLQLNVATGGSAIEHAKLKAELDALYAAKQKNMEQDPAYIAGITKAGETGKQAAIDTAAYQLVLSNRMPWEEIIIKQQEHQEILKKYPELYEYVARAQAKFANQTLQMQGQAITQLLTGVSQVFMALGQKNKSAFEAGKGFAIASATINAFLAFTKELSVSPYPSPFREIAAAAVLATGLAQVIQIKNQKYTGAALGGSFRVPGGSMGVDTKLIPMHLAPGERVDVTPATKAAASGGGVLEIAPIRPTDLFSGENMRILVEQMDKWMREGGTGVRFAKVT
jgi:hypothetical protein